MPPPMGQPITVVEKPSTNPAIVRFETNRPLSGMGHERYSEPPSELLDRPVDELARRLFAAGGVERVHINGSVVTVSLGPGGNGAGLGDIVRSLFLHYGDASGSVHPPTDEGDRAPQATADPGATPAAREAAEPAAAEPVAPEARLEAREPAPTPGPVDESQPVEGIPAGEMAPGAPQPEREPSEGPLPAAEPAAADAEAERRDEPGG